MRRLFVFLIVLSSAECFAQTPMEEPDLERATLVSPYYFGPNAFPVPDMLDGRVETQLRLELACDHFRGYRSDKTTDIAFKLSIPLFTKRVSLEAWGTSEWYSNSDENLRVCRLADREKDNPKVRKGSAFGDIFVSTNVQILTEKKWRPDLSFRAALKTASSNNTYHLARYYDGPGYFFDASVAKSVGLGKSSWNHQLRLAASMGFLCWQTDNGRQDDALMYGVMLKWDNRWFSLSETFGGYSGWEHAISYNGDLAHDRPMTLKTRLDVHLARHWDLHAQYLRGLRDYPYQQFRIGAAFKLNIIK